MISYKFVTHFLMECFGGISWNYYSVKYFLKKDDMQYVDTILMV